MIILCSNFRHLNHLITVADAGTLQKACDSLHITQPALTKSLQRMEELLDVRLFERVGRRLRLTPVGEEIVSHGRSVLRSMQDTGEIARQWREGRSGDLKIGLGPAYTPLLTEQLVDHVLSLAGAISIQIETGHSETLNRRLLDGDLDIVIHDMSPDPLDKDLTAVPLRPSTVMGLLRKGHPLAAATSISFEDLTNWPIGHSPAPPRFEPVLDTLRQAVGASGESLIYTENYDALAANCCRSNLIALLPENLGDYYLGRHEGLTMIPVAPIQEQSAPHIFYRTEGKLLPPLGLDLVKWIRERFG